MTTSLPELGLALSVTGESATPLTVDVSIRTAALDTRVLNADLEVLDDLLDAAVPRGQGQIVGFRVTVGGVTLPPSRRLRGITVTRALGEGSTWSLSVPLGSSDPPFAPPLGTILGHLGPPPGLRSVTIDGLYRTSAGEVRSVRLLTNGIVHSAQETWGRFEKTLTLHGLDPLGRYDQAKVDIDIPAGMGLDRGRHVVRRLARAAGVATTEMSLQPAGRMDKSLTLTEEEWLSTARELMEPSGRLLQWDVDGRLTNPLAVVRSQQEAPVYDHVFTLADILTDGVSVDSSSDGPTSVKVVGHRQVTRDNECGVVVQEQAIETWGYHGGSDGPPYADLEQDGSGNLATTIPPGRPPWQPTGFQLLAVLYVAQHTSCGDLVAERRIEAEWKWPTAARYTLASNGTIGGYIPGVFIDRADAVAGDDAQAYLWQGARFVTTRDETVVYTYDEDGYLVETHTTVGGWVHRRGPVKDRSATPGVPWAEMDYTVGQDVLANGEGVADRFESRVGPMAVLSKRNDSGDWSPGRTVIHSLGAIKTLSEEDRTFSNTTSPVGFLEAEEVDRSGWQVVEGAGEYWYEREGESPDDTEEYGLVETERTLYVAQSENGHDRITRVVNSSGKVVSGETETGLEGYLPAATKRRGGPPASTEYEEGEPSENAALALTDESQRIEAECASEALATFRPRRELEIASDWAETVEEARTMACVALRRLTAASASFSLPANFLVREGQVVFLSLPDISLTVHVQRVVHQEATELGGLTTTTVYGNVYVV